MVLEFGQLWSTQALLFEMGSRACLFLAIPLSPSSGYPTFPATLEWKGFALGDFTGNLAVPPSLPRSAGFWGDGPASSSVGSSVRRIWAIGRSSLTHGGFVRVLVKFFNGAVGFGRSMICAFLRAITGWGMLAFRVDLGNRFTDRHSWTSCSVPVRPCGRPSLARSALLQAGVTGARAQRNKHSFPSRQGKVRLTKWYSPYTQKERTKVSCPP
ncbi:uncharacterized protein LOC110434741 [Sorghum bicolor]|nr:uncharacterized protein LOC110434741 [Sorghum bicolor]|eukprot:XP_021315131.1 uncharacterized protein LOC110434741 [Sorghum bicolor]